MVIIVLAAVVGLTVLSGAFWLGYWWGWKAEGHAAEISYGSLHSHVHDRLGLEPPSKERNPR